MLITNFECAKIIIFPNVSKYLIEKSAFFIFFLEIEEIITIFAPALALIGFSIEYLLLSPRWSENIR
jgi:hypothetical protein